MKDSTPPQTDDAASPPAPRPAWRFSGRRGTPVHLRERAAAVLPPEIRQAVTQLAREQSGAGHSKGAPSARAATSALRLPTDGQRSHPVAAAPMPVERRTRPESADVVSTAAPESVPVAPTSPPSEVVAIAIADSDSPVVEKPIEEHVENPVEEAVDVVTQAAETEAKPVSKATVARPSAAARKRRAKAKAKAAKAKVRAEQVTSDAATDRTSIAKRRLFARGRDVDPAIEQVAIEPEAVEVPQELPDGPPTPDAAREDDATPTIETASEPKPAPPLPDPTSAVDGAGQAAWELGRLPILLHGVDAATTVDATLDTDPAEDGDAATVIETVLLDAAIADADADPSFESRPEPAPQELAPLAWQRDLSASPAPIEPIDLPRRTPPRAISDLDARLIELRSPDSDRSRTRARSENLESEPGFNPHEGLTITRQRIATRRAALDDLVAELGSLADSARR